MDRFRKSKGSQWSLGDDDKNYEDENENFISSNNISNTRSGLSSKSSKRDSVHSRSGTMTGESVSKKSSSSGKSRRKSESCFMDEENLSCHDSYEEIETTDSKEKVCRHDKRRIRTKPSQESQHSSIDHDDLDTNDSCNSVTKTIPNKSKQRKRIVLEKVSSTSSTSTTCQSQSHGGQSESQTSSGSSTSQFSEHFNEESTGSSGSKTATDSNVEEEEKVGKEKVVNLSKIRKNKAKMEQMWIHKDRMQRTRTTIVESFSTLKNACYALTHRRRNPIVIESKPSYNVNFGMRVVDPRAIPGNSRSKLNSNPDPPRNPIDKFDEVHYNPITGRKRRNKATMTAATTFASSLFGLFGNSSTPPKPKCKECKDSEQSPKIEAIAEPEMEEMDEKHDMEENLPDNLPVQDDIPVRPHFMSNYRRPEFTRDYYERFENGYGNSYRTGYYELPDVRRNDGFRPEMRSIHHYDYYAFDSEEEEGNFFYKPKSSLTEKFAPLLRKSM